MESPTRPCWQVLTESRHSPRCLSWPAGRFRCRRRRSPCSMVSGSPIWGRPVPQSVSDEVERARFAPKPNISGLEVELKRLGAQEGMDPFSSDLNAFLLEEDAIQTLSCNVFDVVHETWQRRLLASPPPPSFPARGVLANERRAARGGGRPRIELNYELLAQTYWEMATEDDDLGDLRVPAQKELVQRLASQGIRVSPAP